ncbi:polyketide synthase dehydratase domain-containing protein [Kitasatospora sp. NPDC096077]|uniref:polyketide synthase dehydratase domain-containing protein n=1 Tax=Kitasatospora sp. NPDC096077 TaxID=3155544 RepID=UPI0033222F16
MSRPDDAPAGAQVMPRPPQSHWPAEAPALAAAVPGLLDDIVDLHRRTSALHERFLGLQNRALAHVVGVEDRTGPETVTETVLDPATASWLRDHRPSWTVPTVPLTAMADLLARAAEQREGRAVRTVADLQVQRWLPVPGPVRLRLRCAGDGERVTSELAVWWDAADPALSRFAPVADATLGFTPPSRPARFAPLVDAAARPCPYETADLFHGPAFQYLTSWRLGAQGSSGILRAERGTVPPGALHHGLLDGALHVIPGACPDQWDRTIEPGTIGLPHRLDRLALVDPLPTTGDVEVEARYRGRTGTDGHLTTVDLQLCDGQRVLAALTVTLALLRPVGTAGLTAVPGPRRRAYLRDRVAVPELLCSATDDGTTVLTRTAVEQADVPPGTVAALYRLPIGVGTARRLATIAVKEHVARLAAAHPGTVETDTDLRTAHLTDHPQRRYRVETTCDGTTAVVRTGNPRQEEGP